MNRADFLSASADSEFGSEHRSIGREELSSSEKVLSIMELFTPDQPVWTVEKAAEILTLSESTVYRYFRSLASFGLIFTVKPGQYLLGPGIIRFDRQLRQADPLIRASRPYIEEFAAAFPQCGLIFISRLYQDRLMSMFERPIGAEPFQCSYERGELMPMFSGAPALAILAFTAIRTLRPIFRRVASGQGAEQRWTTLKKQFRRIRADGFCTSINDPDPGIIYISVPLHQEGGGVAGSLTFAGNEREFDSEQRSAIAGQLQAMSRDIRESILRKMGQPQEEGRA